MKINLDLLLDPYYVGLDEHDNEVFSISCRLAEYLLSVLKYKPLPSRAIKKLPHLTRHIKYNGMSDIWPEKPILIKEDEMELVDGLTRLTALSLAQGCGTMLTIKLI